MRRKKKQEEEHESNDRWLVSYADFITLLFAFFVVMYAVSSVNLGKYRQLSSSLGSAFGVSRPIMPGQSDYQGGGMGRGTLMQGHGVGNALVAPLPAIKRRQEARLREREQMMRLALDFAKALEPLVRQDKVHIMQTNRGISIDIHDALLFAPGDAALAPSSIQPLHTIAQLLKNDAHALEIAGHTDNTPINNPTFASNWELSAMRASRVVRWFADAGIAENRLSVVGHGSVQPLSENETPAGRARNRRVVISVLYGISSESATDLSEIAPPKQ